MKLMVSAAPCGFGPVSKLLAICRRLPDRSYVFLGEGSALDFARTNPDGFTDVVEFSFAQPQGAVELLAGADACVSVMNESLVFWATRARRPVYFFDSLFSFWILKRSLAELVQIANQVRNAPLPAAQYAFQTLEPHERKVVAHLLATRSFVQRFPGVDERVASLRELGVSHIELTGPMIDDARLEEVLTAYGAEGPGSRRQRTMLVNLGGFKNFVLDADSKGAYLRVMARFFEEYVREHDTFDRVLVCGGPYTTPTRTSIGGRVLEFALLSHGDFLRAMLTCDAYLCTPGLTALHETLKLRRLPLFLPEEHFGHLRNVAGVASTRVGKRAVRLADVCPEIAIPNNDYKGTLVLVSTMEEIERSETTYQRLRARMLDAIAQHLAVPDPEAELGELAALMDGPDLTAFVRSVVSEVEARAARPSASNLKCRAVAHDDTRN